MASMPVEHRWIIKCNICIIRKIDRRLVGDWWRL